MSAPELTGWPLCDLVEKIRGKQVRASEAVDAYLARIRAIDPRVQAYLAVDEEGARRAASEIDARIAKGDDPGPLAGAPIAIKDIFATAGVKTTCASKILAGYVPPYDATAVARLRARGAIVLGKTNMDEFAMGSSNENSAFAKTRNPWDLERTPGGSSGGSAAAVAADLCAGATGTDTGGSIRQPASLSGVVGVKPTYGRVSRYGMIAFASSLDQGGPLSRTVRDAARLLEAMSGHDPLDSTSAGRPVPALEAALARGAKGLRVALPRGWFGAGLDADVEACVRRAADVLRDAGATLSEVELPDSEHAIATYYLVATAEASSNLARYDGVRFGSRVDAPSLAEMYAKTRDAGFGAEVKRRILLGTYVLSAGYYDAYYRKAMQVRTLIRNAYDAVLASHDVILGPVSPTPAFRIGEKTEDPLAMYLSDVYTIGVNLAGLPGMSVPAGFSKGGLPVGAQLIARAWDEEALFRAGNVLESGLGVAGKKPPLERAA